MGLTVNRKSHYPIETLFEARAARHYARQHAGPAGRNLTELNLPVLRANYVCSENNTWKSSGLMTKCRYFTIWKG